ncbi:MAG TPA: hypothetical protein VFA44_08985 [Gaiellaceae bacterium]|nr:hypothetical protein [Gaiellaceae bacterium]
MRLQRLLVVGVAVIAAIAVAVQASAGARSATHVSGNYTVDRKAKVKNTCKPISKANPGVLRCTVSGFTLIYTGGLHGRGVNTFKWIIDCTTGKSYTDGTETFTGSVQGAGSGTLTWGVRSTGTFDCKKGEVTGISAAENLYSGTGALSGLYGSIHRGSATYSGVLSS